ncbi:MAG: AAA family ATPase [Anaerolineaceae bacterium]|nr:AAA family ATPase [Anaerolineaceae bacterium]
MTPAPSGSQPDLSEPLTQREREILLCLVDGLSNQQIANKLYLAEKTVRWYNSQIYRKLGVSNRQEAADRMQALGLLDAKQEAQPISGKHNLPAQSTPFVGREHELVELTALLRDHDTRLITILAPGGMGKTRLALEAARQQIGHYADGVIFVPLASVNRTSDLVTSIAENIGFSFYGEDLPAKQLINFLHERSMLLVLDNFEHLLDGAPLVADIVQSALNVKLLVTSREKLNLSGEIIYAMSGLDFPEWETPQDALEYDAVKLFMQSAHRVRSDFALLPDDLTYLARICRLTEGMPLALVLAAGWIDVLSLAQIAAEIKQGIDILETEMRDIPERHRSIRATFDLTWNRLTDGEQCALMRLAVFRGGFTVEAAQAVADADMRNLRKLANKALVQVSPEGRHDIHDLLRQFSAEKLAASGEQSEIQARHAAFFAEFMAQRSRDIHTNRQLEALELIDPDFKNVRAAWHFMVNHQQWDHLPKFLHSFWFYCDVRSRGQKAVELLEEALDALQLEQPSAESELAIGRILARLGWFYNDIGFAERAASTCDDAIFILRQHNSPLDLAAALYGRQKLAGFLDQPQIALETAQEGLNIARSIGDKSWEGHFLLGLGWASIVNNDLPAALQYAEEGLAILEAVGNRWGIGLAFALLGRIKTDQADYAEAQQWFEKALIHSETFRHLYGVAANHTRQARIALSTHNYPIAYRHLMKALQVFGDAGYQWRASYPLAYVAEIFAAQNQPERAVEILATVHKERALFQLTDDGVQSLLDELETKLTPEDFATVWERGLKRELTAVVAELLAENEVEKPI